MKKLKITIATLLMLSIMLCPITSMNASAKTTPVKVSTTQVAPLGFDWIWLEEKTVNNGEIALWDGTNNSGFLLPPGAKVFFQGNASQYSYVDMLVYKKAADGQFYEIQRLTTTIPNGGAVSFNLDPIYEAGFYAFGIRSYNLSPSTYSIIIGMDY